MKTILDKIKSFNWSDRRLILLIALVILVFMMMDFNNRMVTMLQLAHQERVLQTQKINLQSTKVRLEAQITYANSDRAVEEWARESARLIKPGDHPIVVIAPIEDNSNPIPLPNLQLTADMKPWQLWKELFFGTRD